MGLLWRKRWQPDPKLQVDRVSRFKSLELMGSRPQPPRVGAILNMGLPNQLTQDPHFRWSYS